MEDFSDAPSHLYKRSCPSLCRSVCPVLFSKVKRTYTRRILCRVSGLVFLLWNYIEANPIKNNDGVERTTIMNVMMMTHQNDDENDDDKIRW